jgi:hypothetical protein
MLAGMSSKLSDAVVIVTSQLLSPSVIVIGELLHRSMISRRLSLTMVAIGEALQRPMVEQVPSLYLDNKSHTLAFYLLSSAN